MTNEQDEMAHVDPMANQSQPATASKDEASVTDRGRVQGAPLPESDDIAESIKKVRAVRGDFESYSEDLDDIDKEDMWADIQSEVLPQACDGLQAAVQAALDFVYRGHDGSQHIPFTDFWEHRLEDYTTRFWWCCYAVPWAIEQYDQQRSASPPAGDAVDPNVGSTGKRSTRDA